ncbi:iron-sulfur cluster biosynthesis family protein [Lentilactobacillus sunkii]|uniref:Core domain-containing protein n=1 Tax=Lentilactobacillus sunkii DSM 19904 TaxID=1423808 RepID=A0A0R1L0F5_9LACO|nr:iron-sulfur cluster biosynthesis family protein [Lentilactobacillus sunkii]KRK89008.1 hypothetical protein FD17_GL001967 [Lentilactobacillus sunkii DSM 19904]
MAKIQLSDSMIHLLNGPRFQNQTLLLIADDGGGKYSLKGGACTIGANFNIVIIHAPDPAYPVKLENNAGLPFYTSNYDLTFLGKGLKMDFQANSIRLSDDAELLDGAVQITKGADVLAAFKKGMTASSSGC